MNERIGSITDIKETLIGYLPMDGVDNCNQLQSVLLHLSAEFVESEQNPGQLLLGYCVFENAHLCIQLIW